MKTQKIRFPAEWEPQSGVQLTWPHAQSDWADSLEEVIPVFRSIAEAISQRQKLLVVTHNAEVTLAQLQNCNPDNLTVAEMPTNDTWARDHAPLSVFYGETPVLLDFTFNGWGNKFPASLDNAISRKLAAIKAFHKVNMQTIDFVLEGGSLESDGQGSLLTTSQCLLSQERNPGFTRQKIETQLCHWFGANRVLWLNSGHLEGDDTDAHIDTLARFCSPDTIAYVCCDDSNDMHFTALKAMEEELEKLRTPEGKAYHLVPLPWPQACFSSDGRRLPATYANFLIINQAVLVPTYRVPQDGQALKILASCFPDREIIGIDCRPIIEQNGSLHCLTMQFPEGVL